MTKTCCVGERHYSESINQITIEKLKNPKTQKVIKIIKDSCINFGRNKSQNFTK